MNMIKNIFFNLANKIKNYIKK